MAQECQNISSRFNSFEAVLSEVVGERDFMAGLQDDDCLTEDDWFASSNPNPERMLQFVRRRQRADRTKHGRRKLRLFACGCCRHFWSQLSEQSREAIEIAERYADGKATKKEMGFAWRNTVHEWGYHERTADHVAGHVVEAGAMVAAILTAMLSYTVFARNKRPAAHELWEELARQAAIVRDIFGNPFQPKKPNHELMSATVTDFARRIYDDRNFHLLPRLADLLELAGCNDSEILNHCRSSEHHFRGCWVLDMFLDVVR